MYLKEREILIIDCEIKESTSKDSAGFLNVTFLDLEDGKTYLIKENNIELMDLLDSKLNKLKVTLELTENKGNLKLSFTNDIENLGRV